MGNQLTIKRAGLSQAEIQALIAATQPDNPGEGYIDIEILLPDSIGQGTWITGTNTVRLRHAVIANSPPATGDNCSYKAFLAAGTYTLKMLGQTNTNQGIIKILLDAVQIASFDQYSASLVENVLTTESNIVISTSKIYDLKLLCNTKNASSTDFQIVIQKLILYRTS